MRRVSSPSINSRHDFDHQDLWTDLPGSKDIKKIEVSDSMCISGGYMEPSSQVHCRQSVAGQHQLMAVNCTNDSDWTMAMAMLIENYASQTRRQAGCKLYACNSFQGRPQTLQRRWHHMKAPLCWVVDRHLRTALCFPKSIGSNQPCAQSRIVISTGMSSRASYAGICPAIEMLRPHILKFDCSQVSGDRFSSSNIAA